MDTGELMLGVPCDGLASHPGGSKNIPSLFMLQKSDNRWPDGPLGLNVDLTYHLHQPGLCMLGYTRYL